jgi:Bacterial TniB protein
VAKYPRHSLPERDVIPVLYVPVPTPATLRSVSEAILTAIGDPNPSRGMQPERDRRISKLVRGCGVEMMIFDEAQHLQERGQSYTQYKAADWLKVQLDELNIPVAFVGLPNFAQLLQVNEQLRRRFSRRRNLQFCDDQQGSIQTACLQMYISLGSTTKLTLSNAPYTWEELGERLYRACDGRVGYIKKLLTAAMRICTRQESNEINVKTLEAAFTEDVWQEAVGALNPFHGDFEFRRLDRAHEPFQSTHARTLSPIRREAR